MHGLSPIAGTILLAPEAGRPLAPNLGLDPVLRDTEAQLLAKVLLAIRQNSPMLPHTLTLAPGESVTLRPGGWRGVTVEGGPVTMTKSQTVHTFPTLNLAPQPGLVLDALSLSNSQTTAPIFGGGNRTLTLWGRKSAVLLHYHADGRVTVHANTGATLTHNPNEDLAATLAALQTIINAASGDDGGFQQQPS